MSRSPAHEAHVELLIGRMVRDPSGRSIGRIGEIIARKEEDEIVVSSYLVGFRGWLQTFALRGLERQRFGRVFRVPWDQMDLSDPQRPAVTCPREDLTLNKPSPRKHKVTRRPGRKK